MLKVRRWTTVLEVVGSIPALAKQRIKFLGLLRLPARDYKRSLVSLVAQVGNQWLRQVELLQAPPYKLLTRLHRTLEFTRIQALLGRQ